MARKMKPGQALDWLAVTLLLVFLNTLIVWKWPDSSLWAFGVALVLGVVFVSYVYLTTRNAAPEDGEK